MNHVGTKLWNIIEKIITAILNTLFRLFKIELTQKQWDSLFQFVKFGLVGVWNTLFSYAINIGCLIIFQKAGILGKYDLDMYAANLIAFAFCVLVSFLLNSRFVFKLNEGESRNFGRALLKSYLSYGFTGIILNNLLAYIWVSLLGISKFIAPVFSLFIAIPINFLMNKLWAFKTQ